MPEIHFWSSAEYGGFLEGLVRALNDTGEYQVQQRFLISEQSYRNAHSVGSRLRLRFQQYIGYPLYLCWSLLKPGKAEIVVVSSNTFYAPFLASILHPRVIHLVYDLFPEAMVMSGKIGSRSLPARLIRRLTKRTACRVQMNVLLGRRLEKYFSSTMKRRFPTCVIPVGAGAALFDQNAIQSGSILRVLYCGNFGNLHDLATLGDAWIKLAETKEFAPGIHWHFHCSGPKSGALEKIVEASGIRQQSKLSISACLPQAEWVEAMKSAEIGLVTMIPGAEKVLMPSKTYSAMCAGQAILAIAPEESDLIDLIKEYDCGWWVEPGDVDGLCRILKELPNIPGELLQKRRNAYKAGHKYFSQEVLARQWTELFESIMEQNKKN